MANEAIESLYPTPFASSPLLPLLLISLVSQRHTPITKKDFKDEYDYIIVGAGGAGSVLASRLSEVKCIDVLVLEAGDDPPLLTEVPATIRSFINTDVDWQFITEPQQNTAAGHVNRQSQFPTGKMIGGTSVLTGRLSNRGNRKNYDDWAAGGAKGWSYREVFPYFLRMEDNVNPEFVADGYHGIEGPITTSRDRYYYSTLRNAIRKATTDLGYGVVDSDGPQQTGYTVQQFSVRDGQSCSTAKAYLVPSEKRKNLDVVKKATVTKILIRKKRAVGVQVDYEGHLYQVKARKEVIVSAGAISTPKLLMLSGIGPLNELKKHSIPLVADLPVGLNLHDHIGAMLFYDVSSVTDSFPDQITSTKNIMDYIHNKTGPLTLPEGCLTTSYLNKEDSPNGLPDFVLYSVFPSFTGLMEEQLWDPELVEQLRGPDPDRAAITCVVKVMNPKSRGYVRLQSNHIHDPPIVNPNYFESFEDVETAVAALKKCRRIFESHPLQKLGVRPFETVYRGCENFVKDEDAYYRCIIRTAVVPYYHPVGTAKMGNSSDPTTVVDPLLRVKKMKGLRVVDASVIPTIPWANTLVTVIMIAEKAADIIKSTISCG